MFDVIHIITTIERGGAENAVKLLCQEQVRQGKKIAICPLKGKLELYDEFFQSGVHVDLTLLNFNFSYQILRVRRFVKLTKVLHCHLPRAEILGWLSGTKNKMVITRHNSESFYPRAPKYVSSLISRLVTKNARGIIAISTAVKMFILSNREVRHEGQIKVIHYGYPRVTRRVHPEILKPIDSSGDKKIRIGSLSRLVYQKNIPLMIDFAAQLLQNENRFSIEIAGEGPDRESIEELIEQRSLDKHVFLLGKVPNAGEFLCSLDFFMLTSHYEGFGLALLEAMEAGIPILAPRHSSIPEVLGCNHAGLFEPNNLLDLLRTFRLLRRDNSIRSEIAFNQYKRLELFDVQRYYQEHETVYELTWTR